MVIKLNTSGEEEQVETVKVDCEEDWAMRMNNAKTEIRFKQTEMDW
jgi:phosphoribosyl-AMP cyclohydrolase